MTHVCFLRPSGITKRQQEGKKIWTATKENRRNVWKWRNLEQFIAQFLPRMKYFISRMAQEAVIYAWITSRPWERAECKQTMQVANKTQLWNKFHRTYYTWDWLYITSCVTGLSWKMYAWSLKTRRLNNISGVILSQVWSVNILTGNATSG